MAKKKNDIDKIDDQIEKLKNDKKRSNKNKDKYEDSKDSNLEKTVTKEYVKEEKEICDKEEKEITKEYKRIEDTDTKIFDGNSESVNSSDEVRKELEEIQEDKKIDTKKEEVIIFDRAIDEDGNVDNDHEMSDTFVESRSKFVKKKKMKKSAKIIIILSVLVVLLGVLLGVILICNNDDKDKNTENKYERKLTEKEKEDIINKFGVSLEKVLIDSDEILEYDKAIDLVDNKNKVKCSIHEIYDDKKIYLSKCSIKGVMTKYSYGEEREVIDNTLKVYLEKSTGVATLNKPVASEEPLYDVYNVDCGKTYSKPFLLDEKSSYVAYTDSNGKTQVKNYISDMKVLSELNYSEILPIKFNEKQFDPIYAVVKVSEFYGIYKYNGEQVVSPMYSSVLNVSDLTGGSKQFVELVSLNKIIVSDGSNYGIIDYVTNRSVIPFEYMKFDIDDNFIYAYDKDNNIVMYDDTGKKYFEGYNVVGRVNNEFYILENNNNFYFSEFNGKILYDYGIINNMGMLYNSTKRDKEVLFSFVDEVTTNKCITIIYNYSDGSGTYKSNNTCELK